MRNVKVWTGLLALAIGLGAGVVPAHGQEPFVVGNPLGLPIAPAPDGSFAPISPNVKVFGAIFAAESCSYDPERDLIVVPSRGVGQDVQENDAWVALINHDGAIHTSRWIGLQNPGQRAGLDPPLVLNHPAGSDIVDGRLYVADRDGGATNADPSVAVIRWFEMASGRPGGEIRVEASEGFNDIEVAEDGTIWATQTGNDDPASWQLWRVAPGGAAEIVVQGAPLARPNGVAFDGDGNVVVVNIDTDAVLTFSPAGELRATEHAAQAGSDGLVIMPDGTKYVSSVREGGISRIRPGGAAELIAENIPNPASMCYDAGANQLVSPMNANNALAFIPLE
jgi:hypothetical protein